MTDEQIIGMAKKAKLFQYWDTGDIVCFDEVRHFAKLVAEKEREACLQICENYEDYAKLDLNGNEKLDLNYHATLIRARGEA